LVASLAIGLVNTRISKTITERFQFVINTFLICVMTIKDLFRIFIKCVGTYLVIKFFVQDFQQVISLSYAQNFEPDFSVLVFYCGFFFVTFVILIYKTDWIVNLLLLGKGFDNQLINLSNLDSKTILTACSVIVGGLLFIDSLGSTIVGLYQFLRRPTEEMDKYSLRMQNVGFAVSVLQTMIGALLVSNRNQVASLMSSKEKQSENL
jgi:hypothetical protein